ncbi:MAG: nitronate monooxygenase [Bdellovibrionales bacterium]|nr:nitronate monooxygenase [Bdellovibrionales bacterium]
MTTCLNDYRLTLAGREYVPIMIGGMGVDISTSALALAAAQLGGIGHISDAMNQFVSDKNYGTTFSRQKSAKYRFLNNNPDKSEVLFNLHHVREAQLNHVRRTMEKKGSKGAVFLNIMEKLSMRQGRETLQTRLTSALDGGIDGITLSAGLHKSSFAMMSEHPRFHDAALGIIVSSVRALSIFLRAAKKVGRLPDYVVVEGPLAGGHLGFGTDWSEYSLKAICLEVIKFLQDNDLQIPVIPAGGIFTGGDAVQFMEIGASAVQVATRFTVTHESGLPASAKQAYFRASEEEITVGSISPTGYLMRYLKTSPCFGSSVRPQCQAFGYVLSEAGKCAYIEAFEKTACDDKGKKLPVNDKICLCHHFSKSNCYTCGHYTYRLKDTSNRLADGTYQLLSAEHVLNDYLYSTGNNVKRPEEENQTLYSL